jgi:pyridoxal phosphate enzyme (YggS family)
MLIAPQNSPPEELLSANLLSVRRHIAAAALADGRSVDSVTLIAVSKGVGIERMRAAVRCGVTHFGESYLQEALPKLEALRGLPLTWHFIGRVQANKTRQIAAGFDWVHGIDRLHVAERLAAQRPPGAAPLNLCIQINIENDGAKAGIRPQDAAELAAAIAPLPHLRLRGLMCMLPEGRDRAASRRGYAALRRLFDQLTAAGLPLDTLSMGMSGDYVEAIMEGATLVRVGTAIFGSRAAALR